MYPVASEITRQQPRRLVSVAAHKTVRARPDDFDGDAIGVGEVDANDRPSRSKQPGQG